MLLKIKEGFSNWAIEGIVIVLLMLYLIPQSCLLINIECGQDMDQYIDYSNSLLAGKGFASHKVVNFYFVKPSDSLYVLEILRLPGYSIALTVGRYFWDSPLLILVLNIFLFLGLLAITYYISQQLLSKYLSKYSVWLLALNPVLLFYTFLSGNVDLFTSFFLTSTVATYLFALKSPSILSVSMVTACTIIATLTRQNTIGFILPFLSIYAANGFFINKVVWQRLALAAVLIVASLGVLTVWSYRNYTISGQFTPSAFSGMQIFMEHIVFTPYPTEETKLLMERFNTEQGAQQLIDKELEAGSSIQEAYTVLNKELTEVTYQHILNDLTKFTKHYVMSIHHIFFVYPFNIRQHVVLDILSKPFFLVAASMLLSILISPLLHFKQPLLFALSISCLLFMLLTSFFHGIIIGNRGILPVLPLLTIILLSCFDQLRKKIKQLP